MRIVVSLVWSVLCLSPVGLVGPLPRMEVPSLEGWRFPRIRRVRQQPPRNPRRGSGGSRVRLSGAKLARRLARLGALSKTRAWEPHAAIATAVPTRRPHRVHSRVPAWVRAEVAHVMLPDARLRERVARLVAQWSASPTASIPEACGDWAATKAAYRWCNNPRVMPQQVRVGHQQACLERIPSAGLILAVQDTTSLDFTDTPAARELGPIEHPRHRGLFVHTTLAVTPEGTPVGILNQQVWTRDPATLGHAKRRRQRPFTDKESFRWVAAEQDMLRTLPQDVRVVTVADREADIYDLFQAQRRPGAELLIRAAWDRRVAHPQQHLWATLQATPVQGHTGVALPKTKHRKARNAHLTVRFASVQLQPPKHRPASDNLRPRWITAVLAEEQAAPKGATPVSWMLLTTLSTATLQEALRCLEWYTRRWLVERYHLALKSGCRVEARQFETANALKRVLSGYAMVAWRLLWLTYVARETPLSSCEVAFTPEEWQALACYHHRLACPPSTPPTLKDATLWLAQLGGFLARRRDGEPGVIVLWRGLTRLRDITEMWRLTRAPTTYG